MISKTTLISSKPARNKDHVPGFKLILNTFPKLSARLWKARWNIGSLFVMLLMFPSRGCSGGWGGEGSGQSLFLLRNKKERKNKTINTSAIVTIVNVNITVQTIDKSNITFSNLYLFDCKYKLLQGRNPVNTPKHSCLYITI